MKSLFKSIFLILAISAFLWGAGLTAFTISVYSIKPLKPSMPTDAIIVLTGGNYRVETGLTLWKENLAEQLFVTGVYKSVTRSDLLAERKDASAMPLCCFTLGYEATTTKGNAKEAKVWIEENDIKSIRLVTSTYHMQRALMEFNDQLDDDIAIYPHPVEIPDYTPESRMFWYLALLEYHKILWRRTEQLLGLDISL